MALAFEYGENISFLYTEVFVGFRHNPAIILRKPKNLKVLHYLLNLGFAFRYSNLGFTVSFFWKSSNPANCASYSWDTTVESLQWISENNVVTIEMNGKIKRHLPEAVFMWFF
jgi:hypothetical protein